LQLTLFDFAMKKALLCLAIASLGACKKDSDPVASPSRTDLLTTPKWKITGGTIGSGAAAFPISVILPTCYNDDTFKFNTDKTVVDDAGTVKCNATDPQTQTGSWSFSNSDQTQMQLNVPGTPLNGTFDVKELTSNSLRITGAIIGTPVDVTFAP
jgi:hypothetical protein